MTSIDSFAVAALVLISAIVVAALTAYVVEGRRHRRPPADTMDDDLSDFIETLRNAVRDENVPILAGLVAECLGRAAHAEGRAEGMAERIEYLRRRVEVLEARERGEDVEVAGGP